MSKLGRPLLINRQVEIPSAPPKELVENQNGHVLRSTATEERPLLLTDQRPSGAVPYSDYHHHIPFDVPETEQHLPFNAGGTILMESTNELITERSSEIISPFMHSSRNATDLLLDNLPQSTISSSGSYWWTLIISIPHQFTIFAPTASLTGAERDRSDSPLTNNVEDVYPNYPSDDSFHVDDPDQVAVPDVTIVANQNTSSSGTGTTNNDEDLLEIYLALELKVKLGKNHWKSGQFRV